jgi:hypothetical protein
VNGEEWIKRDGGREKRRRNKKRQQKFQQHSTYNTHTNAQNSSRFYMQQLMTSPLFFISLSITFGKSRMWFASNSSSSKLLEYRKMSSGTFGSEQCRLSTNSTCRLHPLKIGMHLNIVEYFSFLSFFKLNYTTSFLEKYSLHFFPFNSTRACVFNSFLIALFGTLRLFFSGLFHIFSHIIFCGLHFIYSSDLHW